ncbi:hypothetical protein J6590_006470 [Homalodisca vitripennis]|nr:hypothetical protein J6590_006470 [Homalodisca vitripennis]
MVSKSHDYGWSGDRWTGWAAHCGVARSSAKYCNHCHSLAACLADLSTRHKTGLLNSVGLLYLAEHRNEIKNIFVI